MKWPFLVQGPDLGARIRELEEQNSKLESENSSLELKLKKLEDKFAEALEKAKAQAKFFINAKHTEMSYAMEQLRQERDRALAYKPDLEFDVKKYDIKPGDLIVFRHTRTNGALIEQHSFGFGLSALVNLKNELSRLAGGPVMVIAATKDTSFDVQKMTVKDRLMLRRELDAADAGIDRSKLKLEAPLSGEIYEAKVQQAAKNAVELKLTEVPPSPLPNPDFKELDEMLKVANLLKEDTDS